MRLARALDATLAAMSPGRRYPGRDGAPGAAGDGSRRTLSETIARNARAIRAADQLRQVDVAARAGISRATLSMIEGGVRRIGVEDLLALCRGLGVGLGELVAGADPEDLATLGLDEQGRPGR